MCYRIQTYIVEEIKTNHLCHLRKGQTISSRDSKSENKWCQFLVQNGYSLDSAKTIFNDAFDMAILELNSN